MIGEEKVAGARKEGGGTREGLGDAVPQSGWKSPCKQIGITGCVVVCIDIKRTRRNNSDF